MADQSEIASPGRQNTPPGDEPVAVPAGAEICTHPRDIAGPHFGTSSTVQTLMQMQRLCNIPADVDIVIPGPTESPENHREGYFCAYEVFFKGCGLFFPLPEFLLRFLQFLGIALAQVAPNLLRSILCIFTVAAEAGYSIGVIELLEFFSVRASSRSKGLFYAYPHSDRHLVYGFPKKDENWSRYWFLVKINSTTLEILPDFVKWRSPIRDIYYRNAVHHSESIKETNEMVRTYERMLLEKEKEFIDLTEIDKAMVATMKKDAERVESAKKFEEELQQSKLQLESQGKQISDLKEKLRQSRAEATQAKMGSESSTKKLSEVHHKYDALIKLRDRDLKKSAHLARKEIKGKGQAFLQEIADNWKVLEARNQVKSDINELKGNRFLIGQLVSGETSLETEPANIEEALKENEEKLAALPDINFDPSKFASYFADSPPLEDSDLEFPPENLSERFNEFGSNAPEMNEEQVASLREEAGPQVTSTVLATDVEIQAEGDEAAVGQKEVNP